MKIYPLRYAALLSENLVCTCAMIMHPSVAYLNFSAFIESKMDSFASTVCCAFAIDPQYFNSLQEPTLIFASKTPSI